MALAVDSTHSLLVDLAAPELQPPGWDRAGASRPPCAPARMQISEVSVREFSIFDDTVPPDRRGTYLAFTDPETAGMRHLRSLADAGLTHVHLLPAFDFATVPDRRADQAVPACDLAALPPDSPEQQRAVMAGRRHRRLELGLRPAGTTPRRRAASPPSPAGAARILEFRADGRRAQRRPGCGW